QKAFEDAKLVHEFECRGMNRVAAEVAQKIRVLLEHGDVDAGSGQKQAQHHARWTAAGDGTGCGNCLHVSPTRNEAQSMPSDDNCGSPAKKDHTAGPAIVMSSWPFRK